MPTPIRIKSRNSRARTRTENASHVYSTSDWEQTTTVATGVKNVTVNTQGAYALPYGKTMHDWVTTDYAQRIADGEIISLPMDYCDIDLSVSESSLQLRNYSNSVTKFDWRYTGLIGNKIPMPETVQNYRGFASLQNIKNYVQTQALADLNNSGFQGIVSVAEFGKTMQMLLHPLSSITTLLRHVSRVRAAGHNLRINQKGASSLTINGRVFKRYRPVKRHTGPGKVVTAPARNIIVPAGSAISGSVLANNLGLRPMLMDIDAILKQIPALHEAKRNTTRAKQVATHKHTTNGSYRRGVAVYGYTDVLDQTLTCRATVIGEDRFDIYNDFGVTPWDITGAAWESIPFSFILDYVANISDLLSAFKGAMNNNVLMACTVTTLESVNTRTYHTVTLDTPYELVGSYSGTGVVTCKTKARENFSKYDIALAYKPQGIMRPAVVQNLLSLTTQLLVGLSGPKSVKFYR